jgi:ribosomal protein S8
MNIKVVNFLNQLKISCAKKNLSVIFEFNFYVLQLLEVLYREGYLEGYKVICSNDIKKVSVLIKRTGLESLKMVSTPSNFRYINLKQMNKLFFTANKTLVLSTNQGILTISECRKKKVGGLVLFSC